MRRAGAKTIPRRHCRQGIVVGAGGREAGVLLNLQPLLTKLPEADSGLRGQRFLGRDRLSAIEAVSQVTKGNSVAFVWT
jgi:hypothetical protein